MYLKFCRIYVGDKKDKLGENPTSELSVELEKEKELPGNARLYRVGCVCLSVICLLLSVVVVILGLKLHAGSAACTVCSEKLCMEYIKNTRAACEKCPKGWVWYRNHCYFLSTLRLTWEKSQANCTKIGGSLAVITDKEVQNFLTDKGNLNYWIGLRRDQSAWNWVDNQGVVRSFWRSNPGDGDCALLYSREPAKNNWVKTPCQSSSYYICQMAY